MTQLPELAMPNIPPGPKEPPLENPPGNPRPEVPPPANDPAEPAQPIELPGDVPDDVPVRGPERPIMPPLRAIPALVSRLRDRRSFIVDLNAS